MKVLHLISSSGLFGAEQVLLNLAAAPGIDSYVGALNNFHNPHLEVIAEAKRRGLKTITFPSHDKFDFRAVSKVRKFLRSEGIDILHSHNYKSDVIGFFSTRSLPTKWVATNHVWHGTDRRLRFYERLDALALRFSSRVVAVSGDIKADLLRKRFSERHVAVIHNGIDAQQIQYHGDAQQLRKDLGVAVEETVVSIVGRLSPEKGHRVFLQAAKRVLDGGQRVKFLIVGDGPLKNDLSEKIGRGGLGKHVLLLGIRKDMPAIYEATDILVNVSSIEGLPMTILEAMAARVPVIAPRVGAVAEVIRNGENGVLLDSAEGNALAEALLFLLGHPELRQKFADQAYRDVAEKFSVTEMCRKYRNIYQQLLAR